MKMTHYSTASKIYNIKSDSKDPHLELNSKNTKVVPLSTNKEDSNTLSGLLAHYNSDSEHEDLNGQGIDKLDAKVDDFLQEINKLAPGNAEEENNDKQKISRPCLNWQECFDDTSGYPYYWNVATNEVTWEMPEEYKKWLTKNKVEHKPEKQSKDDNQCQMKVNKIINEQISKSEKAKEQEDTMKKKNTSKKKQKPPSSDSEEERIVLITSFSEDSSSDSETEKNRTANKTENSVKIEESIVIMGPHLEDIPNELQNNTDTKTIPSDSNKKEIIVENVKDENIDETVILSRLRTQAKVLQELGGELPKSVDMSIILAEKIENKAEKTRAQGLSLVAGYGDDTDEEEPTNKPVFSVHTENSDVLPEPSQSTLFPITKPIDVKQFESASETQASVVEKLTNDTSVIDNKLFKRKKRLGVSFAVSQPKNEKRHKLENDSFHFDINDVERKGFGFQSAAEINSEEKIEKVSVVKGGIVFVKADVLNPTEPVANKIDDTMSDNEDKTEGFQDIKDVVGEKVRFLSEGKDPVSAVQVMLIQLQTLEAAFKSGGLSQKYFFSWLRETFVDLGKLEDDAAPNGWQCQWDRLNKRYFYRNQQTGETQWEYPDPDIVGGGEAMDICTTPPPSDEPDVMVCELVPPPPPKIREASLTPPPPPTITTTNEHKLVAVVASRNTDELDSHISSASASPVIIISENQPLPPGVDSPDISYFTSQPKEASNGAMNPAKDALVSELDSFYSDIAMLEATTASNTEPIKSDTENVLSPVSTSECASTEQVTFKKKKRSKPKTGQRLDMKKKAVSSLVEKWKKVQNDYL